MKRTKQHPIGRQPQTKRFVLKRFGQALCFAFVFFALGYGLLWCLDPNNFPITSIKFVGHRKYLPPQAIQDVVLPEIRKGFFRLKVSTLQQQLLLLPWIKQAEVRKIWPHQLVIKFDEHTPAARWGDKGMISTEGVLFHPVQSKEDFSSLPLLQGPTGRSQQVWQLFLVMKETLSPAHLAITQLVLAPRGAIHVCLSNGITVFLGTNEIMERLEQFILAYERDLKLQEKRIDYADLRYTSGMAIGWKRS